MPRTEVPNLFNAAEDSKIQNIFAAQFHEITRVNV